MYQVLHRTLRDTFSVVKQFGHTVQHFAVLLELSHHIQTDTTAQNTEYLPKRLLTYRILSVEWWNITDEFDAADEIHSGSCWFEMQSSESLYSGRTGKSEIRELVASLKATRCFVITDRQTFLRGSNRWWDASMPPEYDAALTLWWKWN